LAGDVSVSPTAAQKDVLTQDTELIAVKSAPLTLGLGMVVQVVPFHCCMSVELLMLPAPIQKTDVTQDTASGVPVEVVVDPW
jgi:hypothetical protein